MTESSGGRWFQPAVLILPTLYVVLIAITVLASADSAAAFSRIDGSNPLAAMFLMISNTATVVAVQLLTGTPWWYLIGLTARSAKTRLSAIGAALFSLFTFLVTTLVTVQVLKQDPDRSLLPLSALVQYGFLALLSTGALVSTIYSALRAVRSAHQGLV